MTGTVTKIILTRGFGFVQGDDGQTYFMHVDDLHNVRDWEKIHVGTQVTFERSRRQSTGPNNGLRAANVTLVDTA